jgi:hypothetical protein
MRPLFIILLTVSFILPLSAQVSWVSPSNKWIFHGNYAWQGLGTETLQPGGEIFANNKTYRRMLRLFKYKSGNVSTDQRYIRQDGRKLYALGFNSVGEVLMYDFTRKAGDTIYIPVYNSSNFGYVITSLSTVQVGNTTRAAQNVTWINKPNTAQAQKSVLVEGIGSVKGTFVSSNGTEYLTESYFFLDEPSSIAVDGPERIFCSFSSPEGNFEGEGNPLCLALPTNTTLEEEVQISPTLSDGVFRITYETSEEALLVQLFDLSGRLIQTQTITGSVEVHTDYKGAALVQIASKQGQMTQKIIFY